MPHTVTRWIILQKARRQSEDLRLLVSTWFQDLFHSPHGVLFTFPSRYLFAIDHKIYLVLEGGPPRFSQGFTCPDLLESTNKVIMLCFRIRGYHSLWRSFPAASANVAHSYEHLSECSHITGTSINRHTCHGHLYLTTLCQRSADTLSAVNDRSYAKFGLFPVRSPLLRESLIIFFSSRY